MVLLNTNSQTLEWHTSRYASSRQTGEWNTLSLQQQSVQMSTEYEQLDRSGVTHKKSAPPTKNFFSSAY